MTVVPDPGPENRPAVAPQARRVLACFLIEDSAVIRQNLVATMEELLPLRMLGFAEDEASALQWLASTPQAPDLVIVDVFLKLGTGLNVLPQARRCVPQAKLVVLTNYATPDIRARSLALGADRVFDKSDELDELLEYCAGLASTG